jgi:hypothetical protein
MDVTNRLQQIINSLEEAIVYDDMEIVSSSRNELIFILEELQSDFTDMYPEEDEF